MARTRQKGRLVRVSTYNVRTLAVKGANGYGRDFSVLYEAARLNISVVGLQETRRAGRTEFAAAGFRVFCCGSEVDGHHGVGLGVKESICSSSTYTTEYVDERLMAMRLEISGQSGAVNFVSAYAPTEVSKDETKQVFWGRFDSLVQGIPGKECLYMLMNANARTGRRIEGESLQDEGDLRTYGRDDLNDNGKLLLSFATDNKLAIMTPSSVRVKAEFRTHTTVSQGATRATSNASTTYSRVRHIDVEYATWLYTPNPHSRLKRTWTTTW